MTLQNEIEGNDRYTKVLDHGFVGLVDHMGNDNAIVQAARVSYGNGTKSVREDRGLIRYLMRHKHTSPFEMCEVKLHIKLPIFVMRQLVRHRTSSLNEYSARYSVLTDEFYVPDAANIKPQSVSNKQGRAGDISERDIKMVQGLIQDTTQDAYDNYQRLLGESKPFFDENTPAEMLQQFGLEASDLDFSEDYPGIARELARSVMPVAGYTELYWKQNLHNLFHMLRLRLDPHAQWEIQVFAQAIYDLVKPLYPAACEAFEDYSMGSTNMSRMEKNLMAHLISVSDELSVSISKALKVELSMKGEAALLAEFDLSKREWIEFQEIWKL